MLGRAINRLHNVVKSQRRNISEYAKSFGYRVRKQEIPEPSINPFKLAFCYGGAFFFIYDVIQDRKLHYKTFIEHRQEGREYLKLVPWFNRFTPLRYPEVDSFLGKQQRAYEYEDETPYEMMFESMKRQTFKKNPAEWKDDETGYIKK